MLRELYHLNDEIPLVFEGRPTIIGAEFDLDHPRMLIPQYFLIDKDYEEEAIQ